MLPDEGLDLLPLHRRCWSLGSRLLRARLLSSARDLDFPIRAGRDVDALTNHELFFKPRSGHHHVTSIIGDEGAPPLFTLDKNLLDLHGYRLLGELRGLAFKLLHLLIDLLSSARVVRALAGLVLLAAITR